MNKLNFEDFDANSFVPQPRQGIGDVKILKYLGNSCEGKCRISKENVVDSFLCILGIVKRRDLGIRIVYPLCSKGA